MGKGKRINLPVTNDQLKEEYSKGVSVTDLAIKYKCGSSVIYRRLLEKDRYADIESKNVTGYEIVSINEAMKITGLSRFIITKQMKNGSIPCKRVGNRYMFQLRDIYKMVGIDIDIKDTDKFTEMDILIDNQEKSTVIENTVSDLVLEIKKLKKSVMNENKEAYDMSIMKSLKVINESQNKINESINRMSDEQNDMKINLKNLKAEIDMKNNLKQTVRPVLKPVKNNSLDKFGGQ